MVDKAENSIVVISSDGAAPSSAFSEAQRASNWAQTQIVVTSSETVCVSSEIVSIETQNVIVPSLPIKLSAAERRKIKKRKRKQFFKKRLARFAKRRRRKKNVAFLSKYSLYQYFLLRKPLPLGATKKEIFFRTTKTWTHRIVIKVCSNNIFCTLVDTTTGQVLCAASAGQYKIKITKKRLKKQHKPFLKKFFATIWPKLGVGGLMIFITAPVRMRKKIISLLLNLRSYRFKSKKTGGRRAIFIKVRRKKCFNGCQSANRRRKKRKGIRITK